MQISADDVTRLQGWTFNAADLDGFVARTSALARVVQDGRLIGVGRDAVRVGMAAEQRRHAFLKFARLDGKPALAECTVEEGPACVSGVIRLDVREDVVEGVRIDHDPALAGRLEFEA